MPDILPTLTAGTLPRIAWDSVLDAAVLTSASAVEDDGAVGQVRDWLPWTFWRPTGAGPHIITADLGGSFTVSGFCLAGHDADGLVGVDTWDGAAWVLLAEVVAAGDGATIYLVGDAVSTTQIRFRATGITYAGILWVGQDVILPEGLQAGWSDPLLALRADLRTETTRDGVWVGNAIDRWTASLSIALRNVEATWARDYWLPFLRTCSAQPFFVHWNRTDWPASACLATAAEFSDVSFASPGFVDLGVSFTADPGVSRTLQPDATADALLLETDSGPLLLEG